MKSGFLSPGPLPLPYSASVPLAGWASRQTSDRPGNEAMGPRRIQHSPQQRGPSTYGIVAAAWLFGVCKGDHRQSGCCPSFLLPCRPRPMPARTHARIGGWLVGQFEVQVEPFQVVQRLCGMGPTQPSRGKLRTLGLSTHVAAGWANLDAESPMESLSGPRPLFLAPGLLVFSIESASQRTYHSLGPVSRLQATDERADTGRERKKEGGEEKRARERGG